MLFRFTRSIVSCCLLVVASCKHCISVYVLYTAFKSTQFVVHSRMRCIWLQGISETFSATGTENVSIYRAPMKQHDPTADLAGNMRHFCKVHCKNSDMLHASQIIMTAWYSCCPSNHPLHSDIHLFTCRLVAATFGLGKVPTLIAN